MKITFEEFKRRFLYNFRSSSQDRLRELPLSLSDAGNLELTYIKKLIEKFPKHNLHNLLSQCFDSSLKSSSGLDFDNSNGAMLSDYLRSLSDSLENFYKIPNRRIRKIRLASLISEELVKGESRYVYSKNFHEYIIYEYSNGLLIQIFIRLDSCYQIHVLQSVELHYRSKVYSLLRPSDSLQLLGIKPLLFNSIESEIESENISVYIANVCIDLSASLFRCYKEETKNLDLSFLDSKPIAKSIDLVLQRQLFIDIGSKLLLRIQEDINLHYQVYIQLLSNYSIFLQNSRFHSFFDKKSESESKTVMKSLCKLAVPYKSTVQCNQPWTESDQNHLDDLRIHLNNNDSDPKRDDAIPDENSRKIPLKTLKRYLTSHWPTILGTHEVAVNSSELIFTVNLRKNWVVKTFFDFGGYYQVRCQYALYYVDEDGLNEPLLVISNSFLECFGISELSLDQVTEANLDLFIYFIRLISEKAIHSYSDTLSNDI